MRGLLSLVPTYKLAPFVGVRSESFGALAYNYDTRALALLSPRYVGQILEFLRQPAGRAEIFHRFGSHTTTGLSELLEELIAKGIVIVDVD